MSSLDDVMVDYFQRSVKQNHAIGIPKTFELQESVAEVKGQPFKNEQVAKTHTYPQKNVSPPKPTVTSVTPTSGPVGGGTTLAIVGDNFIPACQVFYDGVLEAPGGTFTDPQHISSVTPAHSAGQVDIEVENVTGLSDELVNAFTFLSNPFISSVLDDFGDAAGGKTITILGGNFVSGATVKLGGINASSVVFVNSGRINCVTPAHGAGIVTVQVINPSGQIASFSDFRYQVDPNGGFLWDNPPPNILHVNGYYLFTFKNVNDFGYRGRLHMIGFQSACTLQMIPGYPGPVMMRNGTVSFQVGGFFPTAINPAIEFYFDDEQYNPAVNFVSLRHYDLINP